MTTDSPSFGKKFLRFVLAQVLIILGGGTIAIAVTEKDYSLPVRVGLFAVGLALLVGGISYRYGLGKKQTNITKTFGPSMSKMLFLGMGLAMLGERLVTTALNHAEYSPPVLLSLGGGGMVLALAGVVVCLGFSNKRPETVGGTLALPGVGLITWALRHPEYSHATVIIMLTGGGLLWFAGTAWAILRGTRPWNTVGFFIVLPALVLCADYLGSGGALMAGIVVAMGMAIWTRGRTRANLTELATRLGFAYEEMNVRGQGRKKTVTGRSKGRDLQYSTQLFKMDDRRRNYISLAANYANPANFCLSLEALTVDANLAESEMTAGDQPIEQVKIVGLEDAFLIRTSDAELAKAIFIPRLREQVRVLTMQESPFLLLFRDGQVLLALQGTYASLTQLAFLEESVPLLCDLAERAENLTPANASSRN